MFLTLHFLSLLHFLYFSTFHFFYFYFRFFYFCILDFCISAFSLLSSLLCKKKILHTKELPWDPRTGLKSWKEPFPSWTSPELRHWDSLSQEPRERKLKDMEMSLKSKYYTRTLKKTNKLYFMNFKFKNMSYILYYSYNKVFVLLLEGRGGYLNIYI